MADLGWRGLYRVGEERAKEVRGIVDSRGIYAQAEEGWADGNCCFISDSANLARPPFCLLPNYERERIRRDERGLGEGKRKGNDGEGGLGLEVNSTPLLSRN